MLDLDVLILDHLHLQKDERALPGTLHSRKFMCPPLNLVSPTTSSFFFSVSFGFVL
jgi:7,8-dihydro-6-hydroxymethylpterin-pyrophosphokinase